jgi:hypothetical protein
MMAAAAMQNHSEDWMGILRPSTRGFAAAQGEAIFLMPPKICPYPEQAA